ncbi:general stress protein [Agromyces italicus]|uniref:general stress protein n=1 Tax=Agromyces italicus TaxID=279572 RepID=UPI0003B51845|nr:general stress protein [Agromyces italicus]
MTNQTPFGGRAGREFPTLPKGETVASFESYAEAQAAVDRLSKAEFPVKELAIVGTDLTSVERITGKLSWSRAAGAGALSGAWFGLFLGLLFFIFAPSGASLGILGAAVLIGAGFGMIFSVVSYSLNRRRRDFTSVMQVLATRYAIIAEPAHVARARNVLGTSGQVFPPAPGQTNDAAATPPPAVPAVPPAPAEPRAQGASADAGAAPADGADGEASAPVAEAPRGLTYGEAQDAARRAAREAREAEAEQRARRAAEAGDGEA